MQGKKEHIYTYPSRHYIHRYLSNAFPQFSLYLRFCCVLPCSQFIPPIYLFILFPSVSLHLYVCKSHTNLHQWLCRIKIELHFLAGVAHPCLFPALYVLCSIFDIIWPTCLLSYPVCSTLCLPAFVFVLMFTESKDVFVLSCLPLLFSEGVLLYSTCRD